MKKKNNLKIVIIGSITGIIFSGYLLYTRRGGYISGSDWIVLSIVSLFVMSLIYYFKSKWEKEE